MKGWGKRLREVRGTVPQEAFAATVGVSRAAWVNYEAERTSPTLETLLNIHTLSGVDIGWLVTGESQSPPVNTDVLTAVIRGVEESNIEIDTLSRAKLISALYADRIKTLEQDENARIAYKGKGSRS